MPLDTDEDIKTVHFNAILCPVALVLVVVIALLAVYVVRTQKRKNTSTKTLHAKSQSHRSTATSASTIQKDSSPRSSDSSMPFICEIVEQEQGLTFTSNSLIRTRLWAMPTSSKWPKLYWTAFDLILFFYHRRGTALRVFIFHTSSNVQAVRRFIMFLMHPLTNEMRLPSLRHHWFARAHWLMQTLSEGLSCKKQPSL